MASNRKSADTKGSVAALRSGNSGKKRSHNWENIKAVLGTLAIFLLIRTFLLEAYRIPSGSMIPTLLVGDWLFVNKLAYGPHVPFTNFNLPGYTDPKRGDVVVFESPPQVDQPWDPTPTLVKRCVAVAGDTIQMKGGLFHVNGMPQPQGYAASKNLKTDGSRADDLFAWQKKFALHNSRFGEPAPIATLDDWGPLIVPTDHFFMLGDNRYNSKDGRFWGFVPRANVRGRPVFVYYTYKPGPDSNEPRSLDVDYSDKPLPFITDIRWGRIGTVIR